MNKTTTDPNEKPKSLLRRGLSILPTAVVLSGLAALGVWGHHTGWKAPRFSELFGSSEVAEQEDWCEAHNVPDSKCIACHPELAGESGADWCKEHGVPESRCTICHPCVATAKSRFSRPRSTTSAPLRIPCRMFLM